jgi:molybdate transport system substrate-binding protein
MKNAVLIAAACCLLVSNITSAAEIKVLSSGAMKEIYEELAPQFEKSSGHKLVATWSGTALIRKQVGTGEPFDLVIVGAEEIDDFIAAGKVAKGSRVDLVRSAVGVAVKAGSPKPDISSGEAVKKAILKHEIECAVLQLRLMAERILEELEMREAVVADRNKFAIDRGIVLYPL